MSGLCGVVARENCSETLLFGTDYHAHLGSQLAGLAVLGKTFEKKIHDISQGQFKSKFSEDYHRMDGNMGIGVISDRDAQPLLILSRFGTYALTMAGLIDNKDDLTERLFSRGSVFTETSGGGVNSVEVLAKILETGPTLLEGIDSIFDLIQGSASLLILTKDGIYAVRDKLGRLPLTLAEKDGDFMVTTEACAFTNLGYKAVKSLGPGEVVLINQEGYKVLRQPESKLHICAFLWIYTGYPASTYEGIGVEHVREQCGSYLFKRDNVEADFVTGVPDSGIGHAIGYAQASGIPYRRALVKYTPGYGRSYIPPSQRIRDHVAKMKLIAIPDVIRDNRIIICEDSIVRGTQLKNYTLQKCWEAGAKEIHLRPACPPLMYPCRFALSTRKEDELIARRAVCAIDSDPDNNLRSYLDSGSNEYKSMVDWITKHLGATTLQYQTIEDMISAIGLPEKNLCLYCWTGRSLTYDYDPRQKELNLL
ncbi:amidophosphoribosyltransferase [Acidobacteriota bacterium]